MKFNPVFTPTIAGLVLFSLRSRISTFALLIASFFPLWLNRLSGFNRLEHRSRQA